MMRQFHSLHTFVHATQNVDTTITAPARAAPERVGPRGQRVAVLLLRLGHGLWPHLNNDHLLGAARSWRRQAARNAAASRGGGGAGQGDSCGDGRSRRAATHAGAEGRTPAEASRGHMLLHARGLLDVRGLPMEDGAAVSHGDGCSGRRRRAQRVPAR